MVNCSEGWMEMLQGEYTETGKLVFIMYVGGESVIKQMALFNTDWNCWFRASCVTRYSTREAELYTMSLDNSGLEGVVIFFKVNRRFTLQHPPSP